MGNEKTRKKLTIQALNPYSKLKSLDNLTCQHESGVCYLCKEEKLEILCMKADKDQWEIRAYIALPSWQRQTAKPCEKKK